MKKFRILPVLWLLCFLVLLSPAAGQSCLPAPSGLIHWYRGDVDGSDSAGTNSGTLQGGVTITNAGEVGGAFLFDGVSGGVDLGYVPDLDFAPDSSFSLEAWFNTFGPTSPAQDSQAIIMLNYNCTPTVQGLLIGNNPPNFGVGSFLVRDTNGLQGVANSPPVSSTGFHHLVGVREVSGGVKTLRVYLDGVLADTQPDPTTGALAGAPVTDWIGRRNVCGTDDVFNGMIDEVSIYNRALTTSEVQALFNASSAGKCHHGFKLDWFKIAGGGAGGVSGIRSLAGTVGQADASMRGSSGQFSLTGGFWALPIAIQTTAAPTLTILAAGPGQATISWMPNTPGFVLQETTDAAAISWADSPSGSSNPVTVPATLPAKFYRLSKP
jgi:hypothetical protein